MTRLLIASFLIGALFGCKAKDGGGDKVAFLLSTLQEERYQKDRAYFEARARAAGLDVTTLAADNDNAKQLAQVEDALTRGARVLVIQPTDSRAASRYVELAHEAGARVVAYDRVILHPKLDYYVSHDSQEVGVLEAQAALAAVPRGNYIILNGQAGHSVAKDIRAGIERVLSPSLDKGEIRIVAEQSHSARSPEQALPTVEDALARQQGNVQAILAANSGLARGAIQAVERYGLQNVFIAGADADVANINAVCAGKQSVEVLKDVRPLAETAADIAQKLAKNQPLDGSVASIRVHLVTKDNVKSLLIDSGYLAADAVKDCSGILARVK